MTQREARETLQKQFRRVADRNVSFLAQDQLEAEGNLAAANLCVSVHQEITERLWSRFSYDWSQVFYNPGGTTGRAAAFLHAKAALVYERARTNGHTTEEVQVLENELLEALQVFWLEWAGYTLTSSSELEVALD